MQKYEKQLQTLLNEIENEIFASIGKGLKKTKHLSKGDYDKLTNFKKYGYDIDKINEKLEQICKKVGIDFEDLFDETLQENKSKEEEIAKYKIQQKDVPLITQRVETMKTLTKKTLFNLSNTTALYVIDKHGKIIHFDDYYKKAIDKAVLSNTQGLSSWNQEISKIVNELGQSGLRIQYESGYTRRIDSAIRQNILGGIRDINLEMQRNIGEKWGSDGVEITAHALCAEDHLPYQGKQYTNKEYEKLQNSLHRQIGQWNCGHSAIPIFIGISKPIYSKEKLQEFKDNSLKDVEIDGVTRNRYQWSQEMRKIECKLRDCRAEIAMAKGLGDASKINHYQAKYREIYKQYDHISKVAKITKRM